MYVGVILNLFAPRQRNFSIPHVCGGDPISKLNTISDEKYSPCMWG